MPFEVLRVRVSTWWLDGTRYHWDASRSECSSSHHGLPAALVPDLEEAVPGPRGHGHAIIRHSQAADAVVMTSQDTCPVSLERVPDVAVEVVVPGEEEPPALGEETEVIPQMMLSWE